MTYNAPYKDLVKVWPLMLWQKPSRNRKPQFFCQNCGEPKPMYFSS